MESYKAQYLEAVKSCDQLKMYNINRSYLLELFESDDPFIHQSFEFKEWCRFVNAQSIKKHKKKVSDYVWLTINLRPDHNLSPSEFVRKIVQLCSQSKIAEYHFVVEQRGKETFDLKSLHTHILLKRSPHTMPAHIKQSAQVIFKKYCDVKNKNILNFHVCPEEFIQDKLDYIEGDKDGLDKDRRIATDRVMRKQYQLFDVYSSIQNKYLV